MQPRIFFPTPEVVDNAMLFHTSKTIMAFFFLLTVMILMVMILFPLMATQYASAASTTSLVEETNSLAEQALPTTNNTQMTMRELFPNSKLQELPYMESTIDALLLFNITLVVQEQLDSMFEGEEPWLWGK